MKRKAQLNGRFSPRMQSLRISGALHQQQDCLGLARWYSRPGCEMPEEAALFQEHADWWGRRAAGLKREFKRYWEQKEEAA